MLLRVPYVIVSFRGLRGGALRSSSSLFIVKIILSLVRRHREKNASAIDGGPVVAVDVSGFPGVVRPRYYVRRRLACGRQDPRRLLLLPSSVRRRVCVCVKRKPIFRRRPTATAVWRAVRPRGYVCVCVCVCARARVRVRSLVVARGADGVRSSCVQWPKIGCRRRRTYRTPPRHTDDISSG